MAKKEFGNFDNADPQFLEDYFGEEPQKPTNRRIPLNNVLESITGVGKASSKEEIMKIVSKLREKPDEEIDLRPNDFITDR